MTNQPGDIELHRSINELYTNWSLWQKQQGKRVPLGFWSRKFPEAGKNYTTSEKQLLASYWALIDTEQITSANYAMDFKLTKDQ